MSTFRSRILFAAAIVTVVVRGAAGPNVGKMYRQYFEGRRACAFEDEERRELDVTTAR